MKSNAYHVYRTRTPAWTCLTIGVFLSAFLFCLTAHAADDLAVKLPPYTKVQLKNGLTLLLMEQHEVPIISFNIIVKTGSAADPQGKDGVASLTAELLRKGTRSRTSEQISSDLDFIGGEFNIAASSDSTSGNAEFLKKDIREGLDLMSDIVLNPAFPQEEVRKLIEQRVDGIKAAKDRADSVIGRYFNTFVYGKHPYARPVGGDEATLRSMTRADIQKFYESQYVPSNVIFAAAGDFTSSEIRSLIEQRFGSWPAKTATPTMIDVPAPIQGKRLLLVDKPDSTQTYF